VRDETIDAAPQMGDELFTRRPEVEAHRLPDQSLLLFDSESGTAIPVTESGGKIWEMCDGTNVVDQIVANLAASYDAEQIKIERDTREFLAALAEHRLVDRRPAFQ
jgi:hypothetical protein